MIDTIAAGFIANGVTKVREQLEGFIEATVNVADDVERSGLALLVIPERLAANGQSDQLFRRVENAYMPEPFALEVSQGLPQLAALISNNVIAEVAVRAPRIAVPTETFREVEYESNR